MSLFQTEKLDSATKDSFLEELIRLSRKVETRWVRAFNVMSRPRAIVTFASAAMALALLAEIVHSTKADNNDASADGLMGLVSSINGKYSGKTFAQGIPLH